MASTPVLGQAILRGQRTRSGIGDPRVRAEMEHGTNRRDCEYCGCANTALITEGAVEVDGIVVRWDAEDHMGSLLQFGAARDLRAEIRLGG